MGLLYKTFRGVRQSLVFVLMIALFPVIPALSQEMASPYTVQNINVDVTAENALKAREQAFEQAQIKAFEELAGRMMDEQAITNFKTPDALTISSMIQDYEVKDEKLASKRYSGTYTFRFRQSAIQRFFNTAAPQAASEPSEPSAPPASSDQTYPQQTAQNPQQYLPQMPAIAEGAQSPSASGRAFPVHISFSSLQEWTSIQRSLANVYGVHDISLQALSPREAYVDLVFSGELQALQTALMQSGLSLTPPSQNSSPPARAYELRLQQRAASASGPVSPAPYSGRF